MKAAPRGGRSNLIRVLVVLDTGVLGLLVHAARRPEMIECLSWFEGVRQDGAAFAVPAVVDYELRRGLLYLGAEAQTAKLDAFLSDVTMLDLTREVLRQAAAAWADLKRKGLMTGSDEDLGVDVMIGAHAQLLAEQQRQPVIVATNNARHLSRMCDARHWREVQAA